MKHALLDYQENKRTFNIGDYIQSLAAEQFLPKTDFLLNREKLSYYSGEQSKLIMNGWFTHNTKEWTPSEFITPLFVSFHINNTAASDMLNEQGLAYLKKHEPIGCRDHFTTNILSEKGVKAYYTGCLTLTLDSYKVEDAARGNNVYIVDPLFGYESFEKLTYSYRTLIKGFLNGAVFEIGKAKKHLRNIISNELLSEAEFLRHELPSKTYTPQEKFKIAKDLLYKYSRAKLVITSRIHCALPCLALGTPVIFINGFKNFVDSCRFDGLIELFNRVDIDYLTGKWNTNFEINGKINSNTTVKNFDKHIEISKKIKNCCRKFIES